MRTKPVSQHNREISQNARSWEKKPLLRIVYGSFYREIAEALNTTDGEGVLELGSGIGAIKEILPHCTTSDIFENPWLDRVENAYALNFPADSLKGLVLFDVWHHLQYPGSALKEFARVLRPGGRVAIFEPAMGLAGKLIYGMFHHEPLGLRLPIEWEPQPGMRPPLNYYAAQGNCWRTFFRKTEPITNYPIFHQVSIRLMSAITYVASGGFSKPQLYPTLLYPFVAQLERIFDQTPKLFATRMLVILEKRPDLSKIDSFGPPLRANARSTNSVGAIRPPLK